MKILKLEMNNFRQFYGIQSIDFAVNSSKCVTIIHGENNGGKTTILNAIRWCLYNELTQNLLEPQNLLNKYARSKGESRYMVSIQLEHDNQIYEVRRIGFINKKDTTLAIYKIEDGVLKDAKSSSPQLQLNSFLPKEMSQYFFYQGEGTGALHSQNNFNEIENAIRSVLGLSIAEQAIADLKSIRQGWTREFRSIDADDELLQKIELRESLLKQEELVQNLIDTNTANAQKYAKSLEEYTAELLRYGKDNLDNQIAKRQKLEQQKISIFNQLTNSQKNKNSKTKDWALKVFTQKIKAFDLKIINTDELAKKLAFAVDKELIRDILAKQICLCGNHISSESIEKTLLEGLLGNAVDPELKRRWQKAFKLFEKIQAFKNPKKEMLEQLDLIDSTIGSIDFLDEQIKELTQIIQNSNIENLKEIDQKKIESQKKYDESIKNKGALEAQLKKLKIDINVTDRDIKSINGTTHQRLHFKSKISATDKTINLFQEAIKNALNGVDKIILKKMQDFYLKVAFNGETVIQDYRNGHQGNSNYKWTVVDRNNHPVAAGNGFQAMLAISFIVALIQFSKDRKNSNQHLLTPGIIAPFIADSILAFIDQNNSRELLRFISENVEQSVFMLSQSQWTDMTDKGIRDKIGKEYILVQNTTLQENEFNSKYPFKIKINGKEYNTVNFGSEYEYVNILEVELDE